ncbi:MAG TPA: DeoR/GlpR family DNA-binding transcription regulator [Steroidobacteraceae bacterium]|jgi:DeoR family transcriptional regulator, ulaG and ulaABCDEF operon transcriptional repressor|nr:DeoR/GlpR family DNA-binding transcription regulator [Steroidobacteraceae bacterium]
MHSAEREKLILETVNQRGFISFQDLEQRVAASPATIRRDLERMMIAGLLTRVRGGAKKNESRNAKRPAPDPGQHLTGVPFEENVNLHKAEKEAIGRAAAKLCNAGEAVMIDGGSTTLQMCQHVRGLNLQVLTNSLRIVSALLLQPGTRVLVPAGQVFSEQNIILAASSDDGMQRFHAPKLFMSAAAAGSAGLMQADIMLVGVERRLIDRADEIIVLLDSSKFDGPSGHIVCGLDEIDVLITDRGVAPRYAQMVQDAGVKLIVAP